MAWIEPLITLTQLLAHVLDGHHIRVAGRVHVRSLHDDLVLGLGDARQSGQGAPAARAALSSAVIGVRRWVLGDS